MYRPRTICPDASSAHRSLGTTIWIVKDVPSDLPGHDLVRAGLADLAAGRESEASLLIAMARTRRTALGFEVPAGGGQRPSHRLYELLAARDSSAHSHYNALVGRIVSFSRAAERAGARSPRP
jgi:hypothetical protein